MPRRGMQAEGIALLVTIGLVVEWLSILFYADIPKFIPRAIGPFAPWRELEGLLPVLPIAVGTLPGAIIALSGLVLLKSTLTHQKVTSRQVV